MAQNTEIHKLRLQDFADAELLAIVVDVSDDEGWAASKDIASAVGLHSTRANNSIGARFAAYKRVGLVEGGNCQWRLTSLGMAFLSGKVSATMQKSLGGLSAADRLMVTRALASQAGAKDTAAGLLVRREWRRSSN